MSGKAGYPDKGVAAMSKLPLFLEDMLNNPPQAGNGLHGWFFSAAKQLHHHYDQPTIVELLKERTQDCGRTAFCGDRF